MSSATELLAAVVAAAKWPRGASSTPMHMCELTRFHRQRPSLTVLPCLAMASAADVMFSCRPG